MLPKKDPTPYRLIDTDAEKRMGFSLSVSLQRAATSPLLANKTIFLAKSVKPDPDTLRRIIECAGGSCITCEKDLLKRLSNVDGDGDKALTLGSTIICISSSTGDQEARLALQDQGLKFYSEELLFSAILRQELHSLDEYLL